MSTDRRPLKSRATWWALRLSTLLLRLGIQPNQISAASVVCAALSASMFLAAGGTAGAGFRTAAAIAAGCFIQFRLLCNMLDGMVAVEGGMKSKSGEIYNEFPDRLSDLLIITAAGYGACAGSSSWAPFVGWSAAAGALLTAYVRALGAAAGTPNYFCGPMAKPHRMALLTGACLLWALETQLSGTSWSVVTALLLVTGGCIVTVVRRLKLIVACLEGQG